MKQTAHMEIARTKARPENANIEFSDKSISRLTAGQGGASGTSTNIHSTGKITPLELDIDLGDLTKNENQVYA